MNKNTEPLSVWLRFAHADDEEAEAEANTFRNDDGTYRADWSLTAVGLVKSSPEFPTHDEARAWLTAEGFEDFTA